VVDHYPGVRHDYDRRGSFDPAAARDFAHNEMLVLLEHLPPVRRTVFVVWSFLVGTRKAPGLAQWVRFAPARPAEISRHMAAVWRGRVAGWRAWRRAGR
jgi:hypothetical protein